MTKTLQLITRNRIDWEWEDDASGVTVRDYNGMGTESPTESSQRTLANGTGASQANALWHDRRTLAVGASENLDLAGVLVDVFGAAITFARIKGIYVKNLGLGTLTSQTPTDDQDLLFGGYGPSGFPFAGFFNGDPTAVIRVNSGGEFYLDAPLDGWSVGNASNDILKVERLGSTSGNVVYDIAIWGTQ